MEMKLQKLWPLIGAMCLGLTSATFAQSNYQNSTGNGTYGSADSSSSQGTYQRGTFREITPNAGPRVAHGADVFVTADFIWWKVSEEGLAFGSDGINLSSGVTKTGKTKFVGEEWAPGFKAGLGLSLGHDGWDIYSQYTWLYASECDSFSGDYLFVSSSQPFPVKKSSGDWNVHFNVIDLELGRNFYLSQFLTLRPHFGLKGTWQSHDFTVNVASSKTDKDATATSRHKTEYDVWGIGVRGGLQAGWYFTKNWSIYGNLAASALWTNYCTLKEKATLTTQANTATPTTVTGIDLDNDNIYACKYVAELELGLRWETWFYDDNYHFAIQAGWEQQSWINWSKLGRIADPSSHDFSVQGLNLKFRFDF